MQVLLNIFLWQFLYILLNMFFFFQYVYNHVYAMLLLTRHPTTTYYSFDRGDEIDNIFCNFTTDNLITLLLKQKDLTYIMFCTNLSVITIFQQSPNLLDWQDLKWKLRVCLTCRYLKDCIHLPGNESKMKVFNFICS